MQVTQLHGVACLLKVTLLPSSLASPSESVNTQITIRTTGITDNVLLGCCCEHTRLVQLARRIERQSVISSVESDSFVIPLPEAFHWVGLYAGRGEMKSPSSAFRRSQWLARKVRQHARCHPQLRRTSCHGLRVEELDQAGWRTLAGSTPTSCA